MQLKILFSAKTIPFYWFVDILPEVSQDALVYIIIFGHFWSASYLNAALSYLERF